MHTRKGSLPRRNVATLLSRALEGEIHRCRAKDHQDAEGAPARPIGRLESRMLAGLQDDVMGLPEERIVRANPMRPRRQFVRDGVAKAQHADVRAVHLHEYLAEADVLLRVAAYGDTCHVVGAARRLYQVGTKSAPWRPWKDDGVAQFEEHDDYDVTESRALLPRRHLDRQEALKPQCGLVAVQH